MAIWRDQFDSLSRHQIRWQHTYVNGEDVMGKGKGTELVIVCFLASVLANGAAGDEERVVQLKDDPYRHIALENAVVRVWEAKVPIGEWTPFHEHKADEVSVRINSTVLVNVP